MNWVHLIVFFTLNEQFMIYQGPQKFYSVQECETYIQEQGQTVADDFGEMFQMQLQLNLTCMDAEQILELEQTTVDYIET